MLHGGGEKRPNIYLLKTIFLGLTCAALTTPACPVWVFFPAEPSRCDFEKCQCCGLQKRAQSPRHEWPSLSVMLRQLCHLFYFMVSCLLTRLFGANQRCFGRGLAHLGNHQQRPVKPLQYSIKRGSIFLPKCRHPLLWRNWNMVICFTPPFFLPNLSCPKSYQPVVFGMVALRKKNGPNGEILNPFSTLITFSRWNRYKKNIN